MGSITRITFSLPFLALAISLDIATDGRNRPGVAKVRVEVDLTKPQVKSVWVGQEDTVNPLKGFVQKIEYEGVPKYCRHCKLLGHSITQCRAIGNEKEMQKKELNADQNNLSNEFTSEAETSKSNEGKTNQQHENKDVQENVRNQRQKPTEKENRLQDSRDTITTNTKTMANKVITTGKKEMSRPRI